jgi:hypothetical protein
VTTRHRNRLMREARLSAGKLEVQTSALTSASTRLKEAGRVLPVAHAGKLQAAHEAITAVMAGLGTEDATADEATKEATRTRLGQLAEAYSAAADDAGDAARIISLLLELMSQESTEPEQLAVLSSAFAALMSFVQMEVAEIGTPEDDTADPYADMWGWEAARKRLQDSGGPLRLGVVTAFDDRVRLTESAVPISESALGSDGTGQVKVIAPGWGSSGYYSEAVLKRDGPKVFPKDTKMFWDHPTVSEEYERPERSLRDLAGLLTADAEWNAVGYPDREGKLTGPGLYAPIKAYEDYVPTLNEIASNIGVSIVAYGKQQIGEAEGKTGPLITELVAADSVDFVTTPGAGGQVLQLFEAARPRLVNPAPKEATMEVEKDPAFVEMAARAARAEERVVLSEAREVVSAKLAEAQIPDVTRTRLQATLAANPPAKDGALDRAAFETRIDEAVAAEVEYLSKLKGAGQIVGMGVAAPASAEDVTPQIEDGFRRLGMTESAAKVAAAGRK